jgi:two-component sensor histidine kinase
MSTRAAVRDGVVRRPSRRGVASYKRELDKQKQVEEELRQALRRDEDMLREMEAQLNQQQVLIEEFDHRLINSVQLIASILSLQSRATHNAEASAQLAAAANRVAAIERVHRRLHGLEHAERLELKQYLVSLCQDIAGMLPSFGSHSAIRVEGGEIDVAKNRAVPLGLITNELVTNSAKYGKGSITVRLGPAEDGLYALAVFDDGPGPPPDFNPARTKGLGMKIVSALVRQVGGSMRVEHTPAGTRMAVLFAPG